MQAPPLVNLATPQSRRERLRYRNLKNNKHHGDQLTYEKANDTTRLHFQNTNGFQLVDPQGGAFYTASKHLRDLKIDASGFSEINLDTQKYTINRKLRHALSSTSKHNKLQTASSAVPSHHEYKP